MDETEQAKELSKLIGASEKLSAKAKKASADLSEAKLKLHEVQDDENAEPKTIKAHVSRVKTLAKSLQGKLKKAKEAQKAVKAFAQKPGA